MCFLAQSFITTHRFTFLSLINESLINLGKDINLNLISKEVLLIIIDEYILQCKKLDRFYNMRFLSDVETYDIFVRFDLTSTDAEVTSVIKKDDIRKRRK